MLQTNLLILAQKLVFDLCADIKKYGFYTSFFFNKTAMCLQIPQDKNIIMHQ